MRLTLELLGHTLTLALEAEAEAEPDLTPGDVFATTDRRPEVDFDDRTLIGYVTSKGRS